MDILGIGNSKVLMFGIGREIEIQQIKFRNIELIVGNVTNLVVSWETNSGAEIELCVLRNRELNFIFYDS